MIQIDVYADVVCPWCYVGEKRLEKALQKSPDLTVERRWHPYQLRPETPAGGLPWREFAVDKFGGEDRMRTAFSHVSAAGKPDGVRFDFDDIASAPNTVDAHRLILHAADSSRQWETADALFRAYFVEGANLNNHEELVEVAIEADLDADGTRAFLSGNDLSAGVWSAQEKASRVGVRSVPFYIFNGRYALSGAQPVEMFIQALDVARNEYAV